MGRRSCVALQLRHFIASSPQFFSESMGHKRCVGMKAPESAPPFFVRWHLNRWVYTCLKFLLPIDFE
jgi:hypothetical protein